MSKLIGLVVAATLSACASSQGVQRLPRDALPAAWETATSSATGGSAWVSVFADPVLQRLLATAKARNLDLRIAAARIQEARALERAAGAALAPELDASVGASYGRSKGAASPSFGLRLSASWEPDLLGRLGSAERAAHAQSAASEADRGAVELLLLAQVAETYVEFRLRRAQHGLSLRTVESQAGTVRITRARFEQGLASRLDLERALTALSITRARIPQAVELASAARHRLALLLAEPPEWVTQALGEDRPLPDSNVVEVLGAPAEVIRSRPDVRAAEWRFESALARREGAEALRYPRLDLAGMIGLETGDLGVLLDPISIVGSLGAGLVAPLIDFGRIRAQIEVADARQEQAYLAYEQTVRGALEEAQTAIMSYTQGVLRQKELEAAVASAGRAAKLAKLQYGAGALSLLEVLDAERSLQDAELSWSQATADVSVRLIALHRTLGG